MILGMDYANLPNYPDVVNFISEDFADRITDGSIQVIKRLSFNFAESRESDLRFCYHKIISVCAEKDRSVKFQFGTQVPRIALLLRKG